MNIRNSQPKLNKKKAKEVIEYILWRCGPMEKSKLECLLYFCDFDYYEKYEKSFMGFTYKKRDKKLSPEGGA